MKTETLEIVKQLNQEIYDNLTNGEELPPRGFTYVTDGFSEIIQFEEFSVWSSEEDGHRTEGDYERTKEFCYNSLRLLYDVLGDVINQIKS